VTVEPQTAAAARTATDQPPAIALFSDVHGNRLALEAVLADLAATHHGPVYCLGDLVGYGPDPNGVIDLLRERGIPSLLGNYDQGVAWETGDCGCYYADDEAKRIGDASYAYTVAEVTAQNKAYLRSLPRELYLELAGHRLHLVHGSPRRLNEYLLRDRDQRTYQRLAAAETADVLAFGHTHDPWVRRYGRVLFVNVGSVGRPKDGDPRAVYVVLSAPPASPRSGEAPVEVEIRRVTYDVEAAARAVLAAGLPTELAQALREGR
jgi:predicted phosphodiesterase